MTVLPLLALLAVATPVPGMPPATDRSTTAPAASVGPASVPGLPGLPRIRVPGRGKKRPDASPIAAVDRRLRRLVAQEESWFVQNARYGNNVSKIAARDASRDAALDMVQVQVLYASKRGWTAIGSHPDAPGKTCVVYVGYREMLPLIPRTRADAKEAVDEGRPACDG